MCGKTEYAKSLASCPEQALELNSEHCEHPDLRAFCPGTHKLVLFDEATATLVLHHKKLFQGPAAVLRLGTSGANMYSYSVWLNGIMLVVGSNTWSDELDNLRRKDAEWLQRNSVHVVINSPLWVPTSSSSAS